MSWYKWAKTRRIYPEEEPVDADKAEAVFRSHFMSYGRDKELSHVAEEDGEIIGALASGWSESKWDQTPLILYSFDLAVMPEHRRRGVGKSLIDGAIRDYELSKRDMEEATGRKAMMRIWVVNPYLVTYLQSIGFRMEDSYGDGSAHLARW